MSGGDSGGFGGASIPQRDCDDLIIRVRLSSVDESVLRTISVSDVLSIDILENSIVAKKGSDIVGSIASRDVVSLLECMKEGKVFIGTVIEVSDGKCIINITPKRNNV